jgi:Uma2 family endonuclease
MDRGDVIMSAIPKPLLTAEQYLERERRADFRSEFYRGEMFARAGGPPPHSLITANIICELGIALKGGQCTAYESNLRIRIPVTGLYTYPDASVICGSLEYDDEHHDTVINPTLFVEVLSDSAEAYDRGKKFNHYRQLDSLQELLLVAQDSARVERFARNAGGTWTLTVVTGLDRSLHLPSIAVTISLAEIYDKVDLSPLPTTLAPQETPRPD